MEASDEVEVVLVLRAAAAREVVAAVVLALEVEAAAAAATAACKKSHQWPGSNHCWRARTVAAASVVVTAVVWDPGLR